MVSSGRRCRSSQCQDPFSARENIARQERSPGGAKRNRDGNHAQGRSARVQCLEKTDRIKFAVTNFFRRAEWIVAALLSAMAVFLLIVRVTHAGPLWRDECAVV